MNVREFWAAQRNSTRLAFALQMAARAASSLLALWWLRALDRAMGTANYGTFISFQSFTSLAGLAELGIGTVVVLRIGRDLGTERDADLPGFLTQARTLFVFIALISLMLGLVLSPWLPHWFGMQAEGPRAGSMPVLFCLGSFGIAFGIVGSYIASLNYAVANLTWPIVPLFILGQLALVGHWLLARLGASLAVQYLPYLVASLISLALYWNFVRVSHERLARLWPLRWRWQDVLPLIGQSFWSYLWSIGNTVYVATDRILINKGFGGAQVTPYFFSGKLIELAFFVIVTAGVVSFPKLMQWLASKDPRDRQRLLEGLARLNNVQAFLGCAAGIGYLAVNDAFIRWWFGPQYSLPLHWQWAFALSISVTAGGSAVMQVVTRCGDSGLRYSGAAVGIAAFLNFGLSFVSMKLGSIFGIALATVIAQSFFSLTIARYVCRFFGIPYFAWILRNWFLPITLVSIAYAARLHVPTGFGGWLALAVVFAALLVAAARITGINIALVRSEWSVLRGIFRGRQND